MFRKLSSNSAWLIAFFACFAVYLSIACYPFVLSNNQNEPLTLLQGYYLVSTQYGWLGLIALPFMLLSLLLSFLPTRAFKGIVIAIAICLLIMFKVDILVFQQYKLHINALLIRMFFEGGGDVFDISWMSWLIFISEVAVLVIGLACTVWVSNKLAQSRAKFVLISVWFAVLLSTQMIHAYKNALYDDEVSQFSNNWPLYYPLTARKFIYKHDLVDENIASKNRVELTNIERSSLNYPLAPIQVQSKERQPNVLFILVDAWRYSDATPEVMPNVSKFAEKTVNFTQHMSGGNSSGYFQPVLQLASNLLGKLLRKPTLSCFYGYAASRRLPHGHFWLSTAHQPATFSHGIQKSVGLDLETNWGNSCRARSADNRQVH